MINITATQSHIKLEKERSWKRKEKKECLCLNISVWCRFTTSYPCLRVTHKTRERVDDLPTTFVSRAKCIETISNFMQFLFVRENTSPEQSESMAKSTYDWYSNLFITPCTVYYGERELCLFNNKPKSSHVWYLSSIQHQNLFLIGLLSINLKWLDILLIWDFLVNYGVNSISKSNL